MSSNKNKNTSKQILSRRTFLKALGLGSAGVAVPAIVSCAQSDKQKLEAEGYTSQEPPKGKMTYRTTPTTHDRVSLLGYGMMRLPKEGDDNPALRQKNDGPIVQEMVNRQVLYALEHGVNYFDTSPVYCEGKSEGSLGVALKAAARKFPRKSYYIATKMSNQRISDPDGSASKEMFENSLKQLQTSYIDYYLLHSIGGGDDPDATFNARFIDNGILDWILQQKQTGRIRNLGFSYHGDVSIFDRALKMHDDGLLKWDFVQIELNYLDWKHANELNSYNTDAEYLYGELVKRGIPAVIMEPLLGGRLAHLPRQMAAKVKALDPEKTVASWAFRYAGTWPGVLTCLSGMTYMEHLRDNLRSFCPLVPLTEKQMRMLENIAGEMLRNYQDIPCNDCKYCMPCPYGLDIPGIFVHYNKCLNEGDAPKSTRDPDYVRARRAFLVGYDRSVPRLRQADHCIGCGKCVPMCPQQIRIPREMERISRYVDALKQSKDPDEISAV